MIARACRGLVVAGLVGLSVSSFAQQSGTSDNSPTPSLSPSGVRYSSADTRPWEVRMCEDAKVIVIGRVESKVYGPATYRADVTFRPMNVMTTTTLLVEGMIAGEPRDVIELRYRGDDKITWSLSPDLTVGKRYLFFMLESERPFELGSYVKVISSYEFPSDIEVPPDSILRAIWEEHCLPGRSIGTGPTQALLPLMTDRMRTTVERRCEHY